MADKVMQIPAPGIQRKANTESFFKPSTYSANIIHRKCEHCEREEEERKMQRKESNSADVHADSSLQHFVNRLPNDGQSLSSETKSFFEPRFGYDFSNVKIHTDTIAAKSAESINAKAYTTGSNIVFNQGMYEPSTDTGKNC